MERDPGSAETVQAAEPSPEGKRVRSLVVFVHVPKTAGTTLSHLLRANEASTTRRIANVFKGGGGIVDPPGYDRVISRMREDRKAHLLWGHMPFGISGHMPSAWDARYITFLRNPVDRAISHYYHLVSALDNPIRHAAPDPLEPDAGVARFSEAMPFDRVLSDIHYIADNLHTRMLSGLTEPFGPVTDDMLERAQSNLVKRFAMFGLVDRFEESLVLLKQRMGYANILFEDQRVNSARPRGDAVPQALREAAENANQFDLKLYRFAQERFAELPELSQLDFQIELAALRRARSAATDSPPPPSGYSGGDEGWRMLLDARVENLKDRRELGRAQLRTVAAADETQTLKDAHEKLKARSARLEQQVARLQGKLNNVRPVAPRQAGPKRAKKASAAAKKGGGATKKVGGAAKKAGGAAKTAGDAAKTAGGAAPKSGVKLSAADLEERATHLAMAVEMAQQSLRDVERQLAEHTQAASASATNGSAEDAMLDELEKQATATRARVRRLEKRRAKVDSQLREQPPDEVDASLDDADGDADASLDDVDAHEIDESWPEPEPELAAPEQ